jgi:HNH endonuclease
MAFKPNVKEKALLACGRSCCICHKFCGIKMELHHIILKSEGGKDSFDNCIPLCLDCHSDMTSYDHKHPKGTKYTRDELYQHRDKWYGRHSAMSDENSVEEYKELDRTTYQWIVSKLPYVGIISFLDEHCFGQDFNASTLYPLEGFIWDSRNPGLEFMNPDLELRRQKLINDIVAFHKYWPMNTYPVTYDVKRQGVNREWEHSMPDRLNDTIDQLNSLSRTVVISYNELIRTARRHLNV